MFFYTIKDLGPEADMDAEAVEKAPSVRVRINLPTLHGFLQCRSGHEEKHTLRVQTAIPSHPLIFK